jgi:hypothetical protein
MRPVSPPLEREAVPGVTNMKACRASSCNDSRIMMPAFADGSTFCRDATLTRTSRSPEEGRYAKWNSSDVPPTSVPPPTTVTVLPEVVALPATTGAPMSPSVHPGGSDDV